MLPWELQQQRVKLMRAFRTFDATFIVADDKRFANPRFTEQSVTDLTQALNEAREGILRWYWRDAYPHLAEAFKQRERH